MDPAVAVVTLLVRVTLVAVVGTVLSVLVVDPHRAYWTVAAGIAVIGVNAGRHTALVRGSQRFVGTVLGGGLFVVLALVPMPAFLLPLLLGGLQFAVEMFVVRNYALALVFITPLVLFITSPTAAGGSVPLDLIGERLVDTLVGAALGTVSGLIHPHHEGELSGHP